MHSHQAVLSTGWRSGTRLPVASPVYLTISVAEDEYGEPVLVLAGDLDVASRDDLWQVIQSLLDNRSPQTVTLDLAGVGFADCSSLNVLVRAHQEIAARNGRLISTGAQPVVRKVLRLTGLDGYLDLREGSEALARAPDETEDRRDPGAVTRPGPEDLGLRGGDAHTRARAPDQ